MTEGNPDADTTEVLVESHPSLRPTLATIAAVVVGAALVAGALLALGGTIGQGTAETLAGVVAVVAALVVLRYIGRLYILRRTTYRLTDSELREEFTLFFHRSSRTVPVDQLRGLHLSQTAFQRLFGHGSVAVLTAGPNRSLGFLTFDDVPEPDDLRDRIRTQLRERQRVIGEGGRERDTEAPVKTTASQTDGKTETTEASDD